MTFMNSSQNKLHISRMPCRMYLKAILPFAKGKAVLSGGTAVARFSPGSRRHKSGVNVIGRNRRRQQFTDTWLYHSI